MRRKYAFPFLPQFRVNVPGTPCFQGIVSFPASKSDGECGPIMTEAKPAKSVRGMRRLPPGPSPEETEGRIIFVVWIGDDGTRHRGYFTEACLAAANPA
jgi:hypothetical protein